MKFAFAHTGDKSHVKELLAECALPYPRTTQIKTDGLEAILYQYFYISR